MPDPTAPAPDSDPAPTSPSGAAERALAEAAARRAEHEAAAAAPPPEQGGRGGLDPVRYKDWEIGGIAVDF